MSSGPKNVTSTTNTEPPEFLIPSLKDAASAAQGSFGASSGIGGSLIPQSQNLISQTLGGKFLSPDSNPYLEQTFNRGADLITKRLNTSFAGAGRDLNAARPVAADELGTFAANLFGDNLRFERGNQIDALRSSLDFDPLNQFINRLAGIIPGAGGTTQSTQPVFRTGLF